MTRHWMVVALRRRNWKPLARERTYQQRSRQGRSIQFKVKRLRHQRCKRWKFHVEEGVMEEMDPCLWAIEMPSKSKRKVVGGTSVEMVETISRRCPMLLLNPHLEDKVEMLWRGLKELGILKNGKNNSYHQLNPTSIGHYLGMDVHDCSMVGYDRPLKPGVVITIEPGVYIPSFFEGPGRFAGTGIRIEDEVLITESGHEVLTASIPKEIKQIELLLNNFSYGLTMDSYNNTIASTC